MRRKNPYLVRAIILLKKAGKKARIYKDAAIKLDRGSSHRVEVNVGKISLLSRISNVIFVPGKVLGSGAIEEKVIVGAFAFSRSAAEKIKSAGGEALGVDQFISRFPEGKGVLIAE